MIEKVVFKLAAEGGSISIVENATGDQPVFYIQTNESALIDLLDDEDFNLIQALNRKSKYLRSFQEALFKLEQYSWTKLYPITLDDEDKNEVSKVLDEIIINSFDRQKWEQFLNRH